MKKSFLLMYAMVIIFTIACQPSAHQTEAVESTHSSFTTSGEDIELLKRFINSFVSGDWETYRSCLADSVYYGHNIWLNDDLAKTPSDIIVENHRLAREERWDGMSVNPDAIYEVVTDDNGNKFGHVWCQLSTLSRTTGNDISITLFGSYWIKDNKIHSEWALYDRSTLE